MLLKLRFQQKRAFYAQFPILFAEVKILLKHRQAGRLVMWTVRVGQRQFVLELENLLLVANEGRLYAFLK